LSSSLQVARRLVPLELRHRVWQQRMLHSLPRAMAGDVEYHFARIAQRIDCDRLRRLHAQHRRGARDLEEACHYTAKLRIAIVKAMIMGLHVGPPLRIFDIGHGGGYFVIVCRYFGHACTGSEVPIDRLPANAARLYAEITASLGFVDEQRLFVEPYHPLGLQGTYDLICAHKICFNGHREAVEWSVPQWRFFIDDARRSLAPGGRIVLELNERVDHYGRMRWYHDALRDYFASVGVVDRNRIVIEIQR
jgi:SAM-dependent methyltransferase